MGCPCYLHVAFHVSPPATDSDLLDRIGMEETVGVVTWGACSLVLASAALKVSPKADNSALLDVLDGEEIRWP
jgi:hypothetical protein